MFFTLVVGVILFIYLLGRIRKLESVVYGKQKAEAPVIQAPTAQVSTPVVAAASQPVMPTPPKPVAPPQPTSSNESAVGGKIFTGIGILALVLGIGFFLRYAFENNLVSPGMRVFIGVIFGLIIIAVGHFLSKKISRYGFTLIGGGLSILYLSLYAAYDFYNLVSFLPAMVLLLLVTLSGVMMALFYNSQALVAYSFLGAFIMPFLLPISLSVHTLFWYLIVINLGVLLVARFKVWPALTVGSLLGTTLIYLKWIWGPYELDTAQLIGPTFAYLTLIFLIYFVTSMLNFLYRDRNYRGVDGFLLYAVPTFYFILGLPLTNSREETAILALAIGVFYVLVSFVLRAGFAQFGDMRKCANAMLFLASPFIALSIALHFEGRTVTILWAVEAIVMVGTGYMLETRSNRLGGLLLSILVGFKMISDGSFSLPAGSSAIFNERSATMFFVACMYAAIWWFYLSYISRSELVNTDEKTGGRYIGAVGLFVVPFIWINLEIDAFLPNASLYVPIIWLLYAALMTSISFISREKILRFFSYFIVCVSLLYYAAYQFDLDVATHGSFFNIRMATAAAYIVFGSYLLWLLKRFVSDVTHDELAVKELALIVMNAVLLTSVSLEIVDYFNSQSTSQGVKRVTLSSYWLAYALVGLAVGIIKRSSFARSLSVILFAVTICKIFLYDTADLSDVYRFVSFASLGVILLVAGYAYYRFKDRISEFVHVENRENV